MRLSRVIITGFRSVQKTEELLLDEKTNILIGANDHGKTNLLRAIQCLNDDNPILEEDRNWDLSATDLTRIQWHFKVGKEFVSKFEQEELKGQSPKARKEPSEGAPVDGSQEATVVEEPHQEPSYYGTNSDSELVFCRESGEGNRVLVLSTPSKISTSNETALLALRPRVELFEAPKTNLVDRVNLTQLETKEFEFMQGIFRLAGLWEDRKTLFVENDKTSKLLNEASNRLTKILNNNWNQGKDLTWKLIHVGTNGDHIEIKIQDPSVKVQYTRPSLRSSGFQTYFLISMIILARTQNNKGGYIYLFDEPGTYLHPRAQLDLQRSFEIISDDAQLVYTTHALFLINKNYPNRNKVVSKTDQGTKIDQKPFLKNWKAARDSLGILLSNNFLIAEKTLLTEGPSDVIYILSCIKQLKADQLIDVDLNDLSIVDAGDQDNYVAMAKLMLSEGRAIVALLDGDKSGQTTERRLGKVCEKEMKEKRLQISKLPKDKSTEDIFTDHTILQESIKAVAESLVNEGIRELKDGINIDHEVKAEMFSEEEKLSKLSISLDYEDRVAKRQLKPSKDAQEILELLRTVLQLRSEKSAEKSVFEEVRASS